MEYHKTEQENSPSPWKGEKAKQTNQSNPQTNKKALKQTKQKTGTVSASL